MILNIFARAVSLASSWPVYLVAAFLFYFGSPEFYMLIGAFVLHSVAIFLLRLVIRTERSDKRSVEQRLHKMHLGHSVLNKLKEKYLDAERRSFASAHVARVAAFGTVMYSANPSLDVLIVFIAGSALVGLSRLQLKRHNQMDLVAGFLLGVASAYAASYLAAPFFA